MSYPETQPGDPQTSHQPHPNTETATEEPAQLGPAGRFSGVLFSPGEAFKDVNRKPTWIAPLVISLVAALLGTFAFNAIVKPDWDRLGREGIKKRDAQMNTTTPPENVEREIAVMKVIGKFFPLIAIVVTPIYYLVIAGIFALGLMLMQAKTTFKKIFSVVLWSGAVTSVVGTVVMLASLLVKDRESLDQINPMDPGNITATNLGAFMPSDISAPLKAIATSLDIFTIWFLVLLTIGFAAIAGARKIGTGQTGALVFGLWIVWVLLGVGRVALMGA
ncbi:MAG TPA: Yip1 family protein [Blastocatellia bacterium]|nr:Yip1 family protein [Blastocatellia bacterium]